MKQYKKDSDKYLKMSQPHDSIEVAEESLKKFYEELGALREKYKMRDVLCVIYDSYKDGQGESGEMMHHISYGNQLNAIVMAAFCIWSRKERSG